MTDLLRRAIPIIAEHVVVLALFAALVVGTAWTHERPRARGKKGREKNESRADKH